jgi:putative transposase
MHAQGAATRQVKNIIDDLCDMDVSSTQVSRAAARLDVILKA